MELDRVHGVLLGQACGDALGVPYESDHVAIPASGPRMVGGGLGHYRPGEWSDDTQMAVCIAQVSATGADLTTEPALDQIAEHFLAWAASGPGDMGTQISTVLRTAASGHRQPAARVRAAALDLHERTSHTAGNGALMRTAIVGLTRLDDADATVAAAVAVAQLTHPDPLATDSCALWSDAIRRAVLGEVSGTRSHELLDLGVVPDARRAQWAHWLDEVDRDPTPGRFPNNGFTVTALQAALAAVVSTRADDPATWFRQGVVAAVQAGHDTDTVAAIAGGLLGALCGASAIPPEWTTAVRGWPGARGDDLTAPDLVRLAEATATAGRAPSPT